MSKKMTKRDHFNALRVLAAENGNEVLIEFIDHELELLAKKNAADKKPTAQQKANDDIKTAILDGMEDGRLYTITDIIKEIPACAELTNQRVSALMRQLKDSGEVVRSEDKRKAYFSKA